MAKSITRKANQKILIPIETINDLKDEFVDDLAGLTRKDPDDVFSTVTDGVSIRYTSGFGGNHGLTDKYVFVCDEGIKLLEYLNAGLVIHRFGGSRETTILGPYIGTSIRKIISRGGIFQYYKQCFFMTLSFTIRSDINGHTPLKTIIEGVANPNGTLKQLSLYDLKDKFSEGLDMDVYTHEISYSHGSDSPNLHYYRHQMVFVEKEIFQ